MFFLVVFLLLGSYVACGQSSSLDNLLAQADSLMAQKSYAEAKQKANQGLRLAQEEKNWEKLVAAYNILFQCSDIQSFEAKVQLDSALVYATAHLDFALSPAYNVLVNNQGIFEYQKGDLYKAIDYLKKVHENQELLKSGYPNFLAKVYNNIGLMHKRIGDYGEALPYYQQAQTIFKNVLEKAQNQAEVRSAYLNLATNYNNIAQVHNYLGQYPTAYQSLSKTLQIYKQLLVQNPDLQVDYGRYCINMAAHFREQKMLDSTEVYLREAQRFIGNNKAQLRRYHRFKGMAFQQKRDYRNALNQFALSLDLLEKYYKTNTTAIGGTHHSIAQVHQDQKDWTTALHEYQKALCAYFPNFKELKDFSKNPTLADIHLQPAVLDVLIDKAAALAEINSLDNALSTYALAVDLLLKMRRDYQARASKHYLSKKYDDIYEKALGIAFNLYNQNQASRYAELAFRISEQNKAALLLEAAYEAEAMGKAQVPDSLRQALNDLQAEIAFYDKLISEETDRAQQKMLETERFEYIQAQQKHKDFIEKKYPRYYQLKYAEITWNLQELRQHIDLTDKALLEYFEGDEVVYFFHLQANGLDFIKLEKAPDFDQKLQEFIALIQSPQQLSRGIGKQRYTQLAFEIYQGLYKPALIDTTKALIIIPDGRLAYLPFEVLLTAGASKPYHRLPYLLHEQRISYAFSAALLATHQPQSEVPHQILAFAPFTEELRYSRSEVLAINELARTNTFFDQAATKQQFLDLSDDYQILHLSTHAVASGQEPHIQFYDTKLALSDLYTLDLKADLAILSACETSLGEDLQGEGIQSLANGFAYAGVSSLVSSLWSVNERSTAQIISAFYGDLANGLNKVDALQDAKKSYLRGVEQEALASPYYWAGFVLVGEVGRVELEERRSFLWWGLGMFFASVGLFWAKKNY